LWKNNKIAANAAIFIAFFVCALVMLPCSYVLALLFRLRTPGMQRTMRKLIWLYGRTTLFLISPWVPVSISRPDTAQRNRPCIIVSNHQSFLDIYLLGAQRCADICLISKAWPYKILFFFAPAMRCAGYINTEALPLEALESLCLQRLREGTSLVLFPEGRRSRTGALAPFRSGAFLLAVRAGVPVCPLVIHNSFSVFAPGETLFTPGEIVISSLEPVETGPFAAEALPHRALLKYVHRLFRERLHPVPHKDTP
jgi:1-acyl-sn-glycerol-3-phosphate acyltransferase